jgi:tetratricopeptide (TPR) repeat protein
MEENPSLGFGYFLKKYARALILLAILVAIFIPIIQMMFIWGLFGLFNHFAGQLVRTLGLNPYLAKAVVLILMVPLFLSFKWAALALSPWRWKTGFAVIACYMVIFYLSMFFLTREHKFEYATGKATKYYARTPEGIRYFDAPGFDPKYGILLKPVDPGVIRSETLRERPPQKIEGATKYFDFATGDPLCWYYEGSDGVIELFDQPGFHPRYNEKLLPITAEIVKKYEKQLEAQKKKQARGAEPPPARIEGVANYFDYATGEPRAWYFEAADGTIDLYDKPGFHPRYREVLKAITPDIAKKYEKQLEKAQKRQKAEDAIKGVAEPKIEKPTAVAEPPKPTPSQPPAWLESGTTATDSFELGRNAFKAGNYAEAISQLEQAVRLNPDLPQAHYLLAWSYNKVGRHPEAASTFQTALRIKPDYILALAGLGWTYNQLGRYQEAAESCKQAVRLKGDFADAHYNLGMAYFGMGNRSAAMNEYKILMNSDKKLAKKLLTEVMKETDRKAPASIPAMPIPPVSDLKAQLERELASKGFHNLTVQDRGGGVFTIDGTITSSEDFKKISEIYKKVPGVKQIIWQVKLIPSTTR